MSSKSHHKDAKNPKFGHLPLSTSGPEECALTVWEAHMSMGMYADI